MLEFCSRGTLSSSQLLLGIDRNLPYLPRQVGRAMLSLGHCLGFQQKHPACRGTTGMETIGYNAVLAVLVCV